MISLTFVAILLLAAGAEGFLLSNFGNRVRSHSLKAEGQINSGRINHQVDLSSEKVAHFLTVKPGEKIVACRCWKSGKFPLCDGAHLQHNKETGDNVGPCVITGSSPN